MSSVGPLAAGFKQVAPGGFVTVVSTLNVANAYAAPLKAGSGGAATVAAPVSMSAAANLTAVGPISTFMRAGNNLKDMGSVVVSSSRVFRKFKAVGPFSATTLGDVSTSDNNFGTFYLEVASDGGDVPDVNKSILARNF
jgi:hypothetical protein